MFITRSIFVFQREKINGANMESENLEKLDYFVHLYVIAHIVGLLSILLVFYWCVAFAGGFGLSGGPLFQWHPLLMSIGFIYLLGNGRFYIPTHV